MKFAVLCPAICSAESKEDGKVEEEDINPGDVAPQNATISIISHGNEPCTGKEPYQKCRDQCGIMGLQNIKIGHNDSKEKHGEKE
ncbi:MAG: hypothetical protein IJZ82_08440 [Lachnospiraceae bacterium]|nr:hypothetical protein [Lachnospiraceae bacterium]